MSPLEIPGHVLIVLMLISLYSREGLHMRKETKVDIARSHYQQLLYRYIRYAHHTTSSIKGKKRIVQPLKILGVFLTLKVSIVQGDGARGPEFPT